MVWRFQCISIQVLRLTKWQVDRHAQELRDITESLLKALEYTSPRETMMSDNSSTDALRDEINLKVKHWAVDEAEIQLFDSLANKSSLLVEFFYYRHPFEITLAFSFYAWFFFYIDDVAPRSSLENYLHVLLSGGSQSGPLGHLHTVLADLFTHWDPVLVNMMVTALMDLMSATVLEGRDNIIQMKLTARTWPSYLRVRSATSPGFSSALFPMTAHPDNTAFIQALPDMDEYMCLINDVLSFHKEALAGETTNHVFTRAEMEGKDPKSVLLEMSGQLALLHHRIAATLRTSPAALATWVAFENGCIAWHLKLDRYRLAKDFGFIW
ncbi:isoprenoid synthase domain-containing protein [Roridomyces roridus]|uniref:Isoprenoid synthase domain-containing protein n=1 Tax=Roridomyces roridus TaxID=1738132 RepID=A0AAD7BEX9_9AGAR|nr:isoprenoid synthase domain-containing protein [Roridomyces roridus]